MSKENGKWSIPTEYNGRMYRSKLEVAWARFFDVHRMRFAYEEEGFDFPTRYLPDFYLPDQHAFVEVKGVLDATDIDKLTYLSTAAAPRGISVVLAETPAGEQVRLCHPTPYDHQANPAFYLSACAPKICGGCGAVFFLDSDGPWCCGACGDYTGNGHVLDMEYWDHWTPGVNDTEVDEWPEEA